MKSNLNIIGILLILAGGTLFWWGMIHIFWTGDPLWMNSSYVIMALGLGLLLWANRDKLFRGGAKTFLNIVGILLILAGAIFFLQGINLLPGSYMTGDPQWAINGGVMIVVAIVLMLWTNRRR
jgi:hypothetical protein